MTQNKYDAIIVRTSRTGLTQEQYTKLLQSLQNPYVTTIDFSLLPTPIVDTYCTLFITQDLVKQLDYDVFTFMQSISTRIDNVIYDYEWTVTINDTEYKISIQ